MNPYFEISLEQAKFYSHIGVSEQERKVGNEFVVDLKVVVDAGKFKEEVLATSVSYAEIYEEVKKVMGSSGMLLETFAFRIATAIKERWPYIESGNVSIIKSALPIQGIDGYAKVEYFF